MLLYTREFYYIRRYFHNTFNWNHGEKSIVAWRHLCLHMQLTRWIEYTLNLLAFWAYAEIHITKLRLKFIWAECATGSVHVMQYRALCGPTANNNFLNGCWCVMAINKFNNKIENRGRKNSDFDSRHYRGEFAPATNATIQSRIK